MKFKHRRPVLGIAALLLLLYVGTAVYQLHFTVSHILFPVLVANSPTHETATFQIQGDSGNMLLVRHYGEVKAGCVVFFPGQHGGISTYEQTLFPTLRDKQLAVFALSYPGQDGAVGEARLEEILILTQQAVATIYQSCPPDKTVLVGRSLGAMLAAYTANALPPAGLVLEAAAPSLSVAVTHYLRTKWYLSPLAWLPVSSLLPHDYSLQEAFTPSPTFPVVIFQGTHDTQTPIADLQRPNALPSGIQRIPVQDGTHSNTYTLAIAHYEAVILQMLTH